MDRPNKPWGMTADVVTEQLDVDPDVGLAEADIGRRQQEFGRNELLRAEQKPTWRILVDQFASLLVGLLVIGAGLALVFGEYLDAMAIGVVIVINGAIGFFTELRAVRSMEALRELGNVESVVLRDGKALHVDAEELVPGDIVVVEGGDVITADLRLVEASRLQANESALTGESVPVSKHDDTVAADVEIAERHNMLFKGTAVTRGNGHGVVVATGMQTELGRISELVQQASDEETPLEKRLDRLGRVLAYVSVGFVALVLVAGIATGKDTFEMVETAIALVVATVPEGLPIVATIALARGMWRMSRQNALLEELAAVETLGSTDIILTDKTGTLTENEMTVTSIVTPVGTYDVSGTGTKISGSFHREGKELVAADHADLRGLLTAAVLCTDAKLDPDDDDHVGDPMEIALLVAGAKAGMGKASLRDDFPEVREEAFDPAVRMMSTFHEHDGEVLVAVKGAPEAVLEACSTYWSDEGPAPLDDATREEWLQRNTTLANDGLRVLAIASKRVSSREAEPYEDLCLRGITALLDPPRTDVRPAIEACHRAGIRVVMVTGDQMDTAKNVAETVGLLAMKGDGAPVLGVDVDTADTDEATRTRVLAAPVCARTSPEQKLKLIDAHKKSGSIVAMIGDGVNDAPALRKANIGVAMGRRGTQVAREAADMVLQDDRFETIVSAVEEGRIIFANIRKFALYLISCNLSEILAVGLVSLFDAPLPILPMQILFLNLVTDVFPALALGVGEGQPAIMTRPPRQPGEPILTRRHWVRISVYAALLSAVVIGGFAAALLWFGWETKHAVTVSFLTLAVAQLFHVFNMSETDSGTIVNEVTRNPWVWGAIALCAVLILAGVYAPGLNDVLGVKPPDLLDWALVGGLSLIPLVIGRLWHLVRQKLARR